MRIFGKFFLPNHWVKHRSIRGVFLLTTHLEYQGDVQIRMGHSVDIMQFEVEWETCVSLSDIMWLSNPTRSNLPAAKGVSFPAEISKHLELPGSALAIIDRESPCLRADQAVIHWSHQWCKGAQHSVPAVHRCAFWLRAENNAVLRKSYLEVIKKVTLSSEPYPMGDVSSLSVQTLADDVLSLFNLIGKWMIKNNGLRREWLMVFTQVPAANFDQRFPSLQSNWWNSDCRFLIATADEDIQVQRVNLFGPVVDSIDHIILDEGIPPKLTLVV